MDMIEGFNSVGSRVGGVGFWRSPALFWMGQVGRCIVFDDFIEPIGVSGLSSEGWGKECRRGILVIPFGDVNNPANESRSYWKGESGF